MAVYANFTIDQGSVFITSVDLENANGVPLIISSYDVRGQVRKTYTALTSYGFQTEILNAAEGKISIKLDSQTTSSMKPGRYVYDIEIESPEGEVTRVLEGQIEITPRVTRA